VKIKPDEPVFADDRAVHRAAVSASDQGSDAISLLAQPASAYLHLPFTGIDSLVGGMAPGDVWFVAAFSGNGKTALLMSTVRRLLERGGTVYYMGLESRPHILRTQLACLRLGYDVGAVLSGAAKAWSDWEAIRGELVADLQQQRALKSGSRLLVDSQNTISEQGVEPALRQAHHNKADLVIIDHIDHLELGTGSAHDQSRRVAHTVLRYAQEYELRLLIATQLNNEAARGDRLAIYQPPQPHHVYMGSHKRMIATGMLGLYRPTRAGLTKDEMNAVRTGNAEPSTILEPGTMGVVCMKHRYHGAREGARSMLAVERGQVTDLSEKDRYSTAQGGRLI
jgi:KaiC/GvpD/RAD55 family RecA-like ATPase